MISAWTTRKEKHLNGEKFALEIAKLKQEEREYINNEVLGEIAAFTMSENIYRHIYSVARHQAK